MQLLVALYLVESKGESLTQYFNMTQKPFTSKMKKGYVGMAKCFSNISMNIYNKKVCINMNLFLANNNSFNNRKNDCKQIV